MSLPLLTTEIEATADHGFPIWPMIAAVDPALVGDVSTVLQVLKAIRLNLEIAKV